MKACVTVSEQHFKRARSIVEKFDVAEIRMDLCQFNTQQIKQIFSTKSGLIATYRCDISQISTKMESLKLALENGASYIDIEYDLDEKYISELVLFAKNYNTKVIMSYHNYNETPSDNALKEVIDNSKKKGADYVKIATKANSNEDCLRLMNLYTYEKNLIAFGLGENAKFTRISCLYFGAPFTYVYFGSSRHQLAEGQLGHRDYSHIMLGLGVLTPEL